MFDRKEYDRKYSKEWQKNNPEKVKKTKKRYRERHSKEIKEYQKIWRANNPSYNKEYKKEYDKAYRKNNLEKIKKNNKKYYENNKENILKKCKIYRNGHKEQISERNKKYRRNNREKIYNAAKKYWRSHKEKIKKNRRKYLDTEKGRACLQRQNTARRISEKEIINTLTSEEWLDILEAYNYRCAYCGCKFDENTLPEKDHVIPISKGGNNVKENIVPACRSCNAKKGNNIILRAKTAIPELLF